MKRKQPKQFPFFKNVSEIKSAYEALDSRWSDESILNTRMLLWLCEFFSGINGKPKKPRKPSDWQRFFGEQIRAGRTALQAAEAWRQKRST